MRTDKEKIRVLAQAIAEIAEHTHGDACGCANCSLPRTLCCGGVFEGRLYSAVKEIAEGKGSEG